MQNHTTGVVDRESLLEAIRRAVAAKGGRRISLREFLEAEKLSHASVFNLFPRWQDALQAAGFDFRAHNSLTPRSLLLEDWGATARALRKMPSKSEYRVRGNFCGATLENHFGRWLAVKQAFLEFSADKSEWNDVRALILSDHKAPRAGRSPQPAGGTRDADRPRRMPAAGKGTVYGALLDFGALRHAPVNEDGVILLFGMLAGHLGFIVDVVRPHFPDCEAIRRRGHDKWERVRVEFEYESRNFHEHKHDAEACDLIICWKHNWPECPLEVLELRSEVEKLTKGTAPRQWT